MHRVGPQQKGCPSPPAPHQPQGGEQSLATCQTSPATFPTSSSSTLVSCCPLVSTASTATRRLRAHCPETGKGAGGPPTMPAPHSCLTMWVTWSRTSLSVTLSLLKSKMGGGYPMWRV